MVATAFAVVETAPREHHAVTGADIPRATAIEDAAEARVIM
jgi:hypothetical protein